MKAIAVLALFFLVPAVIAGCRGGGEIRCDEGGGYALARETPRVRAPDDLDDLDVLREAPLPAASPRPERPASAGCLESPPKIEGDE